MKRESLITKDNPFTLIIASIVLVIFMSMAGLFQSSNYLIYEALPSVFSKNVSPSVVTVVVNDQSWTNEDDLIVLINKINVFAPKDILIFKEYPEQFPNIEKLNANIKIVPIAYKRVIGSQSIELGIAEEFNNKPHIGVAIPPQLDDNMVRMSTLEFSTTHGSTVKSFLHHFIQKPHSSRYFSINFNKVTPFLVEITSQQLLEDKIIKQIVQDKIVIIGHSTFAKQAILRTPLSNSGLGFSLLQFHAISLEAILNDAELAYLSLTAKLTFIIFSLLIALFIMQKLSFNYTFILLLSIIISGSIALSIIGHAIEALLPISEFIMGTLLSYWIYFHNIQNRMTIEENILSATVNNKLSTTTKQKNFNEADNPWLEITSLVQQYLQLDQTIFLEKVPKDHRLKEIHALNCSLSDIKEMRRDYEREPYSSAINENGPIEINRPYFETIADGELEFIVPFLFADEVLGFWAMTIKPDTTWDKEQFVSNVHSFSQQISYLLYNRQAFIQSVNNQSLLQKSLHWLAPKTRDNRLKFNVHSSLNKLSLYQNIFNEMHSSAIIYDLFGRVIEVNRTMEVIAKRCNIKVFNLNALDLLHTITQIKKDVIRNKLKNLILNQQAINFTITSELDKHTYMISVTPVIESNEKSDNLIGSENPFSVIGLLVEFDDVGSMQQLMVVERKINSLYLNDVYNALSAIELCNMELERLNTNTEISPVLLTLQRQIDKVVKSTQDIYKVLDKITTPDQNTTLPVDLINIFAISRRELNVSLSAKNIHFIFDSPKISTMVYANQYELLSILKLMITTLIDDAQPDSSIKIIGKQKIISGQKLYYLSMGNEGFGFPKETLLELGQNKEKNKLNIDVLKLRQIVDNTHHWHSKPRVFSKLGKGLRFSLTLSRV